MGEPVPSRGYNLDPETKVKDPIGPYGTRLDYTCPPVGPGRGTGESTCTRGTRGCGVRDFWPGGTAVPPQCTVHYTSGRARMKVLARPTSCSPLADTESVYGTRVETLVESSH